MKQTSRSLQHHDLYRKYHGQDSEISRLLGECGSISLDPDSTVDAYIETGQEFISADLSFQIDRLEPWNLKSARLQPLVGEITFSFTQEAITKGAADALLTELSNGRVLNTAKRYWTLQGSAVVIHELRDCLSNLDSS